MDELRFARVEQRIDELKDDMSEVKAETRIQSQKIDSFKEQFERHTDAVERHIMGDEKIISHIRPIINVLPHLEELARDHQFKKMQREKRIEAFKNISVKLGIATGVSGLLASLWKVLHIF